jgi:epoxyqueuosine reductase
MPPADPALSPDALRRRAESLARDLGFDACRVAPATRARHADAFFAWLADGHHATMEWLARNPERRADPRLVLPGARSVIVLATNYLAAPSPAARPDARGRIARYAWGNDYHDVLAPRLREFDAALAALGGTQRAYTDTGPVLERDFASEAGLGWNGKSTVQIHRRLGAWFFLSVILTTLELAPDAPEPDRCGSCTRCLDACPTGAISAASPRRLDARRCIAYLTIEHRGPVPEEFREAIGDRIFGCDDCLAVCPWNRFAQASRDAAMAAREHVGSWDLRDYLALDEDGFRTLFRGSPIRRTKRAGFLRNVCLALGNVGTPDDLPALERIAADGADDVLAESARWAIGRIRERAAAASLPPRP